MRMLLTRLGDANAADQAGFGADLAEGLAHQQPASIELQDPLGPWIEMGDRALAIQQHPAGGRDIDPAEQLTPAGQAPLQPAAPLPEAAALDGRGREQQPEADTERCGEQQGRRLSQSDSRNRAR